MTASDACAQAEGLCSQRYQETTRRLDEIMNNHLPHLQATLDTLEKSIRDSTDNERARFWRLESLVLLSLFFSAFALGLKVAEILNYVP
ncbi:MAG: hypothetical protein M0R66_01305 [Candidatus Omnitrophica bacterium]|nr:hypothetical protein [Candidatus Omnitrophota bacterium]